VLAAPFRRPHPDVQALPTSRKTGPVDFLQAAPRLQQLAGKNKLYLTRKQHG
jgi:hypothetical protein